MTEILETRPEFLEFPVYKLCNQIQHYAWGPPSTSSASNFIPNLLGVAGDGKPWAELWMGCHPGGPSQVILPSGPAKLAELISSDPERCLGEKIAKRFNGLPFLFKLLAAGKPLSIQAHPNQAQAQEGFDRDNKAGLPPDAPNRSYRDSNHKPELICALAPFTGLCGFRSPAEIRRLFSVFLESPAVPDIVHKDLSLMLEALEISGTDNGEAALREFFNELLKLAPATRDALSQYILCANETDSPEWRRRPIWVLMREFARLYPGDPAVISPLFMNIFRLEPGEAIFLQAGILHSYCHGFGVELMANSDNVLRGGLTDKFINIPELMKVVDFKPFTPQVIKPEPGFSCFTYPVPCAEFSLTVIQDKYGENGAILFPRNGPAIGIVTEGELAIDDMILKRGESVFIPPASEKLSLRGHFTFYIASCGKSQ